MIHHRHVMPNRDLIEHEASEDCVCGPEPLNVTEMGDAGDRWVYVHHSLDGRELADRHAA